MEIFLEQTKNLESQQKMETQSMDRVFERLQKECGQEYKTFSKALLHMRLKYQFIAKENLTQHENLSEPSRTTEGKTEKDKAKTLDTSTNKDQDHKEVVHVANTPQAHVDETKEKQKNKEKTKRPARSSHAKQEQHQERHLLHRVHPHLPVHRRADQLPLQLYLHAEHIQPTLPLFRLDYNRTTSQQTERRCNKVVGKNADPHNIFPIWQTEYFGFNNFVTILHFSNTGFELIAGG